MNILVCLVPIIQKATPKQYEDYNSHQTEEKDEG